MAGSGDLTAAVFLSRYLETRDIKRTLEMATASIYGIIEATLEPKAGNSALSRPRRSLSRLPMPLPWSGSRGLKSLNGAVLGNCLRKYLAETVSPFYIPGDPSRLSGGPSRAPDAPEYRG
jgi:hypothetical protein